MAHGAPRLSQYVSNLAQRLLSVLYFFFLGGGGSRCIIMPFWQFYFLESFYTDRKILSRFKKFPCTDGLGDDDGVFGSTLTRADVDFE